jgi:hypothetical protein
VKVPAPAKEIELVVVLPVPVLAEPELTWEAKGKRILIRMREFAFGKPIC